MRKNRLRFHSPVPFGLGAQKPHHLRETLQAIWENRDSLGYAWRILGKGVCDGCSLGPRGLRDDVMAGLHLCTTRLRLLRLNTMGPLQFDELPDLVRMRQMSSVALKRLGRLATPMVFAQGDRMMRRISWDEALEKVVRGLRESAPDRLGFYATSRGLTNEAYYAIQKLARLAGTNNLDLASRLCHSSSVAGLEQTLGIGAPTCQLSDFIGTDLLVLWGTNLANNQPVTMKYLHQAKRQGTRIVVVNPLREPGLDRYWVPSIPLSALFGTRFADEFYQVTAGGDLAFIAGVLKHLIASCGLDQSFIADHTSGFGAMSESLEGMNWGDLEERSGVTRSQMEAFAQCYSKATSAVFVWSMGLTQHQFGTDNVKGLVNLCLARGMVGRQKCGLMPIRGHSGVQGGGEIGMSPVKFPGNVSVGAESALRFAALWGHPVPSTPGFHFGEMMDKIGFNIGAESAEPWDLLYLVGGNLLETMPNPEFMERAMSNIKLRVHQDIILNSGTLVEGQEVLILPAQTRYEQDGGGTSTSTERRIRFSPQIQGRQIGQSRAEWWIPTEISRRLSRGEVVLAESAGALRQEIARTMPMYAGIEKLENAGDWIQWGGPTLFEGGRFEKMPAGRALFSALNFPLTEPPPGKFFLSTRRGRQFNSMVYGGSDTLVGSKTDDTILMSPTDASKLGLTENQRILLRSTLGQLEGRLRLAAIRPGNVQGYWPRVNRLIAARYDPISGIPDYNAIVSVEPIA